MIKYYNSFYKDTNNKLFLQTLKLTQGILPLGNCRANGVFGFLSYRFYSSDNANNMVKPIIIYINADTEKLNIFADNRGKVGVYRWINKTNGNTYVGSSVNISVRMYTTNISSLKMNLSFIIGFIDAEGSFTVYMRKDPRYSQG